MEDQTSSPQVHNNPSTGDTLATQSGDMSDEKNKASADQDTASDKMDVDEPLGMHETAPLPFEFNSYERELSRQRYW